jgi:hypothetical protein
MTTLWAKVIDAVLLTWAYASMALSIVMGLIYYATDLRPRRWSNVIISTMTVMEPLMKI